MSHKIHDVGAAKQIGKYSDTIEPAAGLRWLHPSGTPDDGTVPEGVEAQPVSPGLLANCFPQGGRNPAKALNHLVAPCGWDGGVNGSVRGKA